MEIAFDTRELRTICEDGNVVSGVFDGPFMEHLRARIADLRAADTVRDLIAGRPALLDSPPRVVIGVGDGRLVCAVNHLAVSRTEDGSVDWQRVRRLRVTDITR
jgi:hypothetical protein